jgi:hypothetical protein
MMVQVVFAMLLERIFFKSSPSALSLVGTLIILTSALYVAVRPYTLVLHYGWSDFPVQITKNNESKPKSDIIRLDDVSAEGLEEGLLERTRGEADVKSEYSLHVKALKEGPPSGANQGNAGTADTAL